MEKKEKTFIQQVTGTFLFYAQTVTSAMLVALNALASEESSPTEQTMAKVKQLLDYAASQEEAIITYRKSGMVLSIHSNASYLGVSKARSRVGRFFFLSSNDPFPQTMGQC